MSDRLTFHERTRPESRDPFSEFHHRLNTAIFDIKTLAIQNGHLISSDLSWRTDDASQPAGSPRKFLRELFEHASETVPNLDTAQMSALKVIREEKEKARLGWLNEERRAEIIRRVVEKTDFHIEFATFYAGEQYVNTFLEHLMPPHLHTIQDLLAAVVVPGNPDQMQDSAVEHLWLKAWWVNANEKGNDYLFFCGFDCDFYGDYLQMTLDRLLPM